MWDSKVNPGPLFLQLLEKSLQVAGSWEVRGRKRPGGE